MIIKNKLLVKEEIQMKMEMEMLVKIILCKC